MSAPGRDSIAIAAVVWLVAIVAAAQELPKPAGAVNDFANVLSAETEASLAALVESVEQPTTAELAVATIRSLEGTTVEFSRGTRRSGAAPRPAPAAW